MADRWPDIEVCDFAREILSARTREQIVVTASPDEECRDVQAVDQFWESPSHRYAVEHTRVEAFANQLRNLAAVDRLLRPIRDVFFNAIPGDFRIIVHEKDTSRLPLAQYDTVRIEIAKLVAAAAPDMAAGDQRTLRSSGVPFPVGLARRDGLRKQLLIQSLIDAEPDAARRERFLAAMVKKLPKLAHWSTGRQSVLVLECGDIQHSNAWLADQATRAALLNRTDVPHSIVYVETDGWCGHVFKEGDAWGERVPEVNGVGFYARGEVHDLPRY